jgi:hypothetical protein
VERLKKSTQIRRDFFRDKMGQIKGTQAPRLCFVRFAGGTPVPPDRGRLACMRLYSTANERGFDLNRFIGCLSATCRRDARDPAVSPAFQDRRHLAWVPSDSQAGRPRSVDLRFALKTIHRLRRLKRFFKNNSELRIRNFPQYC